MPKIVIEKEEKEKIFHIASKILEENGYENTTIRKICAEANISIGKFYRYFSTKQELFSYFYTDAIEKFNAETLHQLSDLDVYGQIIGFYKWYTQYTADLGLDFVSSFFCSTNETLNILKYNNEVLNTTDYFLEQAIRKGFLLPENQTIHELTCDICVIVKGAIFEWCITEGAFSLPEYTEKLLKCCLPGLLKPTAN